MTVTIILVSLLVIAFASGLFVIPYIVNLAHELHLYDLPDSRKVHQLPIPRLGGVAFMPVIIITVAMVLVVMLRANIATEKLWTAVTIQHFLAYLAGSLMLYSIGLYDDLHGVSYRIKFLVQIVAASLLCISGLWVANMYYIFFIESLPFWIGMPLTVLFIVYLTNAINLIDGIDGLASGLSIISLGVIAALNIISGHLVWAMLAITILGVVTSFFYYNVFDKEHKIFMGDSGSLVLGYTLAFLVLHFWQIDPVWNAFQHNIGIIALSTLVIPMFDVVRVFASRVRDGRNPFLPDKNHIHHKLLRTGMKPKMAMATLLFLSMLFVFINYLVAEFMSQTVMIIGDVVLFCLMHIIINHFISKKEEGKDEYNRAY